MTRKMEAIICVSASLLFGVPPRLVAAGVYNLHLYTDNGPDYTDIDALVRTATEGCTTDCQRCIAIWRMGRRSRRQTSCAVDDGWLIWDPILHYSSYGTMNCGVISGLNIACWLRLGYQARYVRFIVTPLTGHGLGLSELQVFDHVSVHGAK